MRDREQYLERELILLVAKFKIMIKIEYIPCVSNIYSSVNSAIEITSGICNLIA